MLYVPRYTRGEFRCDVVPLESELVVNWRYSQEQEEMMQPCRFREVWLQGSDKGDLQHAIDTLIGNPENTRYTLLVNPDGLYYDTRRLGGDHHVTTKNGNYFCFSVRRGVREDDTILLAIAYE